MPYRALDTSELHARPCPAGQLRADSLAQLAPCAAPEWDELAAQVAATRQAGRPVLCMLGGSGLCMGLGPLVAGLLQRGVVTHVAVDGAAAAHDFELALAGETCLDPAGALSDEVAGLLYAALRGGARDGLGAGEALGGFLAAEPCLGQRDASLLYQAYAHGVPLTVHAMPGADVLSAGPACDFGAFGSACGRDYLILCATAVTLEGGVCLNLAMGDAGAALVENALAAAGAGAQPLMARLDPAEGWPEPARRLVSALTAARDGAAAEALPAEADPLAVVATRSSAAAQVLAALVARQPALAATASDLARAYLAIAASLERGGTLFLCGNGGSMADALHISGEMLKSYTRLRPLPEGLRVRLLSEPEGEALAANLERGLRAVVLGANLSLSSAVRNDYQARGLELAQELYALARPGDVLLGISTSGRAANVGAAAGVARALGLTTIALTGAAGGPLAARADVAVRAPAERTDRVQEQHVLLYHTLCEMLEADFFG